MNSTEKKALVELSKSLADVQDWAKTLSSTVDYLKDKGTEEDNVQKIFEDNHLIRTLEWLTDSIDNVKMLIRILK
jgi:hypothetical protein